MSLRIHICRDVDEADRLIETERLALGDPFLRATMLIEPDIVVYDYSKNPNDPVLVNENKVCVVFQDE